MACKAAVFLPAAVLLASATAVARASTSTDTGASPPADVAAPAPAVTIAPPPAPDTGAPPAADTSVSALPAINAPPPAGEPPDGVPSAPPPVSEPAPPPPPPPPSTARTVFPIHLQGASDLPDHGPTPKTPRHRTFGMSMDVGAPDGAALGLVVRPHFDWLRISGAVTHNGIAPGLRLGVTLDPIAFPIAPTFTVEGGHYWQGTIPMVQDSPDVGYNYANFHLGLEIGNRSTFRFFLRGGASWIDVNTANFKGSSGTNGMVSANGSSTTGSGFGNPTFNGWLAPTGKLGFSLYF